MGGGDAFRDVDGVVCLLCCVAALALVGRDLLPDRGSGAGVVAPPFRPFIAPFANLLLALAPGDLLCWLRRFVEAFLGGALLVGASLVDIVFVTVVVEGVVVGLRVVERRPRCHVLVVGPSAVVGAVAGGGSIAGCSAVAGVVVVRRGRLVAGYAVIALGCSRFFVALAAVARVGWRRVFAGPARFPSKASSRLRRVAGWALGAAEGGACQNGWLVLCVAVVGGADLVLPAPVGCFGAVPVRCLVALVALLPQNLNW